MNADRRTWLCPDCDGWGVHESNASSINDPQCHDQIDCAICDGSGVLEASYAEGLSGDYQPWDGPLGKTAIGVAAQKRGTDPLLDMGRLREERGHPFGGSFYYGIYRKRAMRKCSGLAMADMRAMATRCVTATAEAVDAWRRAAA